MPDGLRGPDEVLKPLYRAVSSPRVCGAFAVGLSHLEQLARLSACLSISDALGPWWDAEIVSGPERSGRGWPLHRANAALLPPELTLALSEVEWLLCTLEARKQAAAVLGQWEPGGSS